jgi:pyrroline-5-carboxylate reductase
VAYTAAVTESTVTDEIRAILDVVGEFVEVDESKMDIATAVNGSGPAFVFYLMDAMAKAGVDGGLSPEDARTLSAQTFKMSAALMTHSLEVAWLRGISSEYSPPFVWILM